MKRHLIVKTRQACVLLATAMLLSDSAPLWAQSSSLYKNAKPPQDKQPGSGDHREKCGDACPGIVDRLLKHATALWTRFNQSQFRQYSFT